jgi:hypothetical protein
MHFPTSLERTATLLVNPVEDSGDGFRDARQQQRPSYVYCGELLDTVSDRSYRPGHNLQISPENRRAIDTYQQIADESPMVGRILDGYI